MIKYVIDRSLSEGFSLENQIIKKNATYSLLKKNKNLYN